MHFSLFASSSPFRGSDHFILPGSLLTFRPLWKTPRPRRSQAARLSAQAEAGKLSLSGGQVMTPRTREDVHCRFRKSIRTCMRRNYFILTASRTEATYLPNQFLYPNQSMAWHTALFDVCREQKLPTQMSLPCLSCCWELNPCPCTC